jgi:radical SAM protein with 4Fe4S-binding SPASM domain
VFPDFKKRYYVPSEKDAPLKRLWWSLTSRSIPSFPKTVQFETHSACNAACIFCPYSTTYQTQPKGFMDDALFNKIVDELSRHKVRRISPYLNNEPFLDRGLVGKLALIKEKIPDSKIVITTNGSKLDDKTIEALIASKSLRALYISFQGIEKGPYEETMRGSLVFEETMKNVENLIEKWKAAGGENLFKIYVTMVATNKIDPLKATEFWKNKGIRSKWTPLENRGGNIEEAKKLTPKEAKLTRYVNCTRLYKQAYILFNGDMVLCCTDYERKVVLGNVGETSIEEVWNSKKARTIRRLFWEGRLDEITLCRDCEISDTEGEEEFE